MSESTWARELDRAELIDRLKATETAVAEIEARLARIEAVIRAEVDESVSGTR